MKAEKIEITEEWLNELSRMPFVSRKCRFNLWLTLFLYIEKRGKTLHLLKAKSKKINPNKRRKKIPLLGTIKDFHNAAQSQNVLSQNQENMNASDGNFTMVNKGDIEIENTEENWVISYLTLKFICLKVLTNVKYNSQCFVYLFNLLNFQSTHRSQFLFHSQAYLAFVSCNNSWF